MNDYIKRADAVNAVCELAFDEAEAEEFAEAIENLPGIEMVPVEDGRYIKAGEVSVVVEDGKPVGFYRPDGPEEIEAEHRAEVFERMAFKLGEERKILLKCIARNLGCGWCIHCRSKDDGLFCKSCGILQNNFFPDFDKIRKEAERF